MRAFSNIKQYKTVETHGRASKVMQQQNVHTKNKPLNTQQKHHYNKKIQNNRQNKQNKTK